MSIIKNIKSLFVVEEETDTAKDKASKAEAFKKLNREAGKKATPITTPPTNPTTEAEGNRTGKANQKFMEILFKAMEANNLDGLDYLEFKQSLNALSKMPMDEATRYKSAFAMASSMGATPLHLTKTAHHYIDVLTKEEQKFERALKQQVDTKIGQQRQEVKAMEKNIADKTAQIKQLTEQISQIQQKVNQKKKAVEEANEKINTTKNDFIASYELIKGQIEADVANMQKYLGANTGDGK